MSPVNLATEHKSRLPTRVYVPRIVGMVLAGTCVGGAVYNLQASTWTWVALLCNALVWPHVAYFWSSRHAQPHYAEERNCLIDSALAGFWIAAMQFQLLPGLLVLAMPTMDASGVGGTRLLLKSLVASALGALAGVALWGWHFLPQASLVAQVASVPFLLCYPILFGSIMYRLVRKIDRQRDALRDLSQRDGLSNVYNRRFFEDRIAQEFENFRRHQETIALIMVDIDNFKQINDVHGHTAGDDVIRRVALVLQEQARRADIVARFGGDEFAVLLPFTDADQALEYVLRVQAAFRTLQSVDARLEHTGISFGIALPDVEMERYEQWIAKADAELYRVKIRLPGQFKAAPAPPALDGAAAALA